jgi:hypothetical protein
MKPTSKTQLPERNDLMNALCTRLWNEQDGFIVSAELLMIATLLVIGLVAGWSSVRDSIVTELADLAQAIANLNQSYSFGATIGHCGFTGGSFFIDLPDFCDLNDGTTQQASKCVFVCFFGPFPGQDGQQ